MQWHTKLNSLIQKILYNNYISKLDVSKSSIKNLFTDLLDGTKGIKVSNYCQNLVKNTNALKLDFLKSISIQQQKPW